MSCGCCEHVHHYCGCTSVAECHKHYFNCVTCPAENCRCHIHEMKGRTDCADGHYHTFKFFSRFDIPLWFGRHIHFFCGVTDEAEGHVHYMSGYTMKDQIYTGGCFTMHKGPE